jgi:hypothetical protein
MPVYKITRDWLEKIDSCGRGLDFFSENYGTEAKLLVDATLFRMVEHVYERGHVDYDYSHCDSFFDTTQYIISAYVMWLIQGLCSEDDELLADVAATGIELRGFWVRKGTELPQGYTVDDPTWTDEGIDTDGLGQFQMLEVELWMLSISSECVV